jgi:hypothetical protein
MRELQGGQEMSDPNSSLERAAERITDHNVAMRSFLLRMLDPEDLGLAVTNEVRELARKLVNMPRKGEPNA